MESIILHPDDMENHMEQIIGILDQKKLISVVFSRNFGANNEFFILKSNENKIKEIVSKSKEILGNIEESTISLKTIESFSNLFRRTTG